MRIPSLALLAVLATPIVATADQRPMPTKINLSPLNYRAEKLTVPAEPSSRLIYVKRCPEAGCVVFPGRDDARADKSSIIDGQKTIGRFKQGDAVWDAMMACVRATYAPFNIGVVDVDPGNVPHFMNIVGGHPSDAGFGNGVGGVAPFQCTEIENAVSYTFDVWGPDAEVLCYVVAQETAHAFGLEHEMNNKDPLTYLSGPFPKRFQAADTPCGEFEAVPCECSGGMQNSYEHILTMFGPGVPTPPSVAITSPAAGKRVQPKFVVRVDATDDVAIDKLVMKIDGVAVAETKEVPYKLVAPADLAEGPHMVEIVATDVQGTPATDAIEIELGPPCTAAAGCTDNEVCVMGGCVAGPGVPGGLGSFCQANTECLSGACLADSTGNRHCTEACDATIPGSCPSDFACLAAGAGGVCWPSEQGGCCSAGGSNGVPSALLALGLFALVVRVRRRRARA